MDKEKEKAFRPKKAAGGVTEVTFPVGDGTHKTVSEFPYAPETDDERRFLAAHPYFTDSTQKGEG